MSRHDDQRLTDILAASAAIADHITRGGLDDGLDTTHAIVQATVTEDLPPLIAATQRLPARR
ncbi:MAG: hypothetical protein ACRDSR_17600 [Pseudonocardiaceae bacterium]